MFRRSGIRSSKLMGRTLTWVTLLVLNLGASIVLIPFSLQRGLTTGALTVTPELLTLTPLQWSLALALVTFIVLVRWLFLTGMMMFFGAFMAANDSFMKTAPVVALSLLPLALEEAFHAALIGTGWFPTTSPIILDLSVLWANAPSLIKAVLSLTDPFQLWGLWILAQGLMQTGVYRQAKSAWTVSVLALSVSTVLGRALLPG